MKQGLSFDFFKSVMEHVAIVFDCCFEEADVVRIKLKTGSDFQIKLIVSENSYPKTIKEIISNNRSDLYSVIITTYVTRRTAEICKNAGFGYIWIFQETV